MDKHKGNEGFTLLEVLLVLSVLSVLLVITIPIGERILFQTTEQEALDSFIRAIYQMQAYAVAHETATELELLHQGTVYRMVSWEDGVLTSGKFPEGIRVLSMNQLKRLVFHPNGEIDKGGTITVQVHDRLIQMRFQFQYGRILIYEQ